MSRYNNRSREREPPLPKPYDFVPIPEKRIITGPPPKHENYKSDLLTGTITGTLFARSPIHVGSGNIELTGKLPSLVKAHFRRNDRPTIPGSSLKGVIRSIVEAISDPPSCLRVVQSAIRVQRCSQQDSLCVACSMFGAMGYFGLVRFSDAVLESGETEIIQIPALHPPGERDRERVYFDNGKVKGRKFYMHGRDGKTATGNVPIETCRVGSRFPLKAQFENLSEGQLALLLTALGQGNPRLLPKLGGGKPICCGSFEITDASVTTIAPRSSAINFEFESNHESLESLTASTRMISVESLNKLSEILQYPGERVCPDRNY
jgi:hypothetical protein